MLRAAPRRWPFFDKRRNAFLGILGGEVIHHHLLGVSIGFGKGQLGLAVKRGFAGGQRQGGFVLENRIIYNKIIVLEIRKRFLQNTI